MTSDPRPLDPEWVAKSFHCMMRATGLGNTPLSWSQLPDIARNRLVSTFHHMIEHPEDDLATVHETWRLRSSAVRELHTKWSRPFNELRGDYVSELVVMAKFVGELTR